LYLSIVCSEWAYEVFNILCLLGPFEELRPLLVAIQLWAQPILYKKEERKDWSLNLSKEAMTCDIIIIGFFIFFLTK
jgi:hypothetical protein